MLFKAINAASKLTTMEGGICCVPTAFFMMFRTMLYFTNPEKQINNTVDTKTKANNTIKLAPEKALSGFNRSIIVTPNGSQGVSPATVKYCEPQP